MVEETWLLRSSVNAESRELVWHADLFTNIALTNVHRLGSFKMKLGVGVHACNLSTRELSLRLASATY